MSANLPMLIVAAALLWMPRGWMRRGFTFRRSRGRSRTSASNTSSLNTESLSFGREFTKARNYYDFMRAFAGALVLVGGSGPLASLQPALGASTDVTTMVLVVQAAVLLIGVLAQTLRYERGRWSLTAPVFYLAGLLLILCTPWPGLCGFVMAWLLCGVVPNAQGFLSIQAIVSAIVAFALYGLNMLAVLGFVLSVLPILLGLMMNRPLIVFSRRSMNADRGVHP